MLLLSCRYISVFVGFALTSLGRQTFAAVATPRSRYRVLQNLDQLRSRPVAAAPILHGQSAAIRILIVHSVRAIGTKARILNVQVSNSRSDFGHVQNPNSAHANYSLNGAPLILPFGGTTSEGH